MTSDHKTNGTLIAMSGTNLVPDDPNQDIRGRTVIDRYGDKIGHISDLFIDSDERKVRFLEVGTGGFLGFDERHALIPVDAVTKLSGNDVHVNQTREHVAKSPAYDPALGATPERKNWEPFYGYYELSPYWGTGYMYPQFPTFPDQPGSPDHALRERHD